MVQVEGSPWASCPPGEAIQVGVIGEGTVAPWQKEVWKCLYSGPTTKYPQSP